MIMNARLGLDCENPGKDLQSRQWGREFIRVSHVVFALICTSLQLGFDATQCQVLLRVKPQDSSVSRNRGETN